MKRFIKGCFVTALILLVLGVGIVMAVALVGDKNKIAEAVYDATDGKVELRLNSWDDFGIHINGDWEGRYDINDADVFDDNHEVWTGNVAKTQINQGTVKQLELEIGGNTLEIRESENEHYYIEQSGDGKLQAYEEDAILYVKAIVNNVELGNRKDAKIILYVPKKAVLEKIYVDLGAGTMKASDLNGKEVECDLGAGYLEWNALNADSAKINIAAGQAVVKDAVLGGLEVSLGAGDCEVQGKLQGNVKVDCAAGNVSLECVGKEKEFNYDLSCTVGNIEVGEIVVSDMNEEKKIDNNASKTMELSVSAGNIEVEFEG